MGRRYYIPMDIASHSAAIDYFEILAAANKPFRLIGFELGQLTEIGDAQEEQLELVLKRVTGAPTSGSGGSTVTAQPVDPNSTAAGVTAEIGNTTKLSGGTSVNMVSIGWNIRGNYLFLPPPEGWITVTDGTRLVLEEVSTVTDAITGPVGWVLIEELV